MSDCEVKGKTMGEKLQDYLDKNPGDYDVTFSVGPEKEIVKGVKMILKAASSVFEKEFNGKWKNAVLKTGDGDGIPLPDVDPTAFRLFMKLLITDNWSVEAIQNQNLSVKVLLNLISICGRFGLMEAVKSLITLITRDFYGFSQTDEFLNMSQACLNWILSCEGIALEEKEVFDCVCRWAENQCYLNGPEVTGPYIREILKNSSFKIRFPLMSNTEFTKILRLKNLQTVEERAVIYEYIGQEPIEKKTYDSGELPFPTRPRKPFPCSSVCLTEDFKIVNDPLFVCNGTTNAHRIKVNQGIVLHGFSFLGPIQSDTYYDVSVTVNRMGSNTVQIFSAGIQSKRIFARKGKKFYFILDRPITLEPITDKEWDNRYRIHYTLKGNNTLAVQRPLHKESTFVTKGIEFRLMWWSSQLADILFKKM